MFKFFGGKASTSADDIVVRYLEVGDYKKGFTQLLAQLTQVGDYNEATFKSQFEKRESMSDIYKTIVIEDLKKGKIIATATLFIELKYIRNCGKCGHIEDVVVDSSYRGLRLGVRVIEALMEAAKEAGCYKIILDCSESNATFYEKCGLVRKELQMVKYLLNESTAGETT